MHAPVYSTISLIAEIIISGIIFYTFYSGYKRNKFPTKLAFAALIYETLFNISYMATRTKAHAGKFTQPFELALAAFHGILSLVMFIALIIFFFIAWRKYKKEINFFKEHRLITILFLIFWTTSIISGILFYFIAYIF